MTALIVIGIIVLIFFLIGRIRVGVDFGVTDDRISLSAKICGFSLQLIPRKNQKKEPDQEKEKDRPETEEKKKKEHPEKKPKKTKSGKKKKLFFKLDLYDIKEMLGVAMKGIGKCGSGFRCERLLIHFTAASWNPYVTARLSAVVNAFLSALYPLLEGKKKCRDCDIRTGIDFNSPWPKLDFGMCVTFRIGAFFGMVFYVIFGILGVLIRIIFRFLRMKIFDPEEYDFRMNQQENPIRFFRRIMRESREMKEQNGCVKDFDPGRSGENSNKDEDSSGQNLNERNEQNAQELLKIAREYAGENGCTLEEENAVPSGADHAGVKTSGEKTSTESGEKSSTESVEKVAAEPQNIVQTESVENAASESCEKAVTDTALKTEKVTTEMIIENSNERNSSDGQYEK